MQIVICKSNGIIARVSDGSIAAKYCSSGLRNSSWITQVARSLTDAKEKKKKKKHMHSTFEASSTGSSSMAKWVEVNG